LLVFVRDHTESVMFRLGSRVSKKVKLVLFLLSSYALRSKQNSRVWADGVRWAPPVHAW
jgi:hypothetical protein